MKYQDSWQQGNKVETGVRECVARYEIIKNFCSRLKQPFTVCDIGANMNYFGLRLTEDFQCTVMSFEFHQFEMRETLVKNNPNIFFVNKKLSLVNLKTLTKLIHFDVVLALSVLHHLPGDSNEWVKEFSNLGNNTILELALKDSAMVKTKTNYRKPKGKIIGYGDSHLKNNFKRPIFLLTTPK